MSRTGFSFDARGEIIDSVMDAAGRQRVLERQAKERATVAAQRAYENAMAAEGISPSGFISVERPAELQEDLTVSQAATVPGDGATEGPNAARRGDLQAINLVDWAMGRGAQGAQWFKIQKAFKEQYGFNPRDKAQAREFMVSEGKVPASQVAF